MTKPRWVKVDARRWGLLGTVWTLRKVPVVHPGRNIPMWCVYRAGVLQPVEPEDDVAVAKLKATMLAGAERAVEGKL